MRLLGLDVGGSRIGVALGDTLTGQVWPLATIGRSTPDIEANTLRRFAEEHAVTELVVGLPLRADGSEGPQASVTRQWAADVEPFLGIPVHWRDERHTSQLAELRVGANARRGASGGSPSDTKRRQHRARIDREAAAQIVQAELDARSGVSAP